jgi:hypothetical protein
MGMDIMSSGDSAAFLGKIAAHRDPFSPTGGDCLS